MQGNLASDGTIQSVKNTSLRLDAQDEEVRWDVPVCSKLDIIVKSIRDSPRPSKTQGVPPVQPVPLVPPQYLQPQKSNVDGPRGVDRLFVALSQLSSTSFHHEDSFRTLHGRLEERLRGVGFIGCIMQLGQEKTKVGSDLFTHLCSTD